MSEGCESAAGVVEVATAGPVRVAVTPAAAALLRTVVRRHGPVMFHQSGGCCDGSAPMCYPQGDFLTGDADVHLGDLRIPPGDLGGAGDQTGEAIDVPVWIGRAQYQTWKHTRLTIDAVPGRGAGFSLESPEGMRFLTRSRLFTPDERAALGEWAG